MLIAHRGIFHSVGQGLFHSASVRLRTSRCPPFEYVYDCGGYGRRGGQRLVDVAVGQYVHNLRGRGLNLIMLSHLHWDHMNGLYGLLRGLRGRAERVILPYLFPQERAMCFAPAIEDGAASLGSSDDEWYLEFLVNPSRFLLEYGAREVTFVRGSGEEPNEVAAEPEAPTRNNDYYGGGTWTRPSDLDETAVAAIRGSEEHFVGNEGAIATHVELRTTAANLGIPWWEFRFFHRKPNAQRFSAFTKRFEKVRGELPLRQLLRSKAKLDELRGAYACIFGEDNLNDTSLAVFSGSASSLQSIWYHLRAPWPRRKMPSIACPPYRRPTDAMDSTGVLLTGDLGVKGLWDSLARKFDIVPGSQRAEVAVVQIPHHGSKCNWHDDLARIGSRPVHVVSARLSGQHPHKEVLRSLRAAGRVPVQVNEKRGCTYIVYCHTTP